MSGLKKEKFSNGIFFIIRVQMKDQKNLKSFMDVWKVAG